MVATMKTQRRFIEKTRIYTESVIEECRDREVTHVRDISDYLILRRNTGAVESCFTLLQLGLKLPATLFEDPTILKLEDCANDLIALGNVSL